MTVTNQILTQIAAGETWFENPAIKENLWTATRQTIYMVASSTIIAVLVGGLLGIALVSMRSSTSRIIRFINTVLSLVVNAVRSIPFVILMFSLIGFSRWLVGTGSDWVGASIPLTIGAIPFFARLIESNLSSVEAGKVEAAQMMGASRTWIVFGVLVRESIPTIIQSITVLTVTLVGYSAMAGVVGGGGLGAMAQNYGYYKREWDALIIIIVVIIIMVQIIQWIGDMLSRLADHR